MEKQVAQEKRQIDDNIIYVGKKPFTNYVWAVMTQISEKKSEVVKVIARGKFISRAVDIVELAKSRLLGQGSEIEVKGIEIGSEKFLKKEENGKERQINVSMIKITLSKK